MTFSVFFLFLGLYEVGVCIGDFDDYNSVTTAYVTIRLTAAINILINIKPSKGLQIAKNARNFQFCGLVWAFPFK